MKKLNFRNRWILVTGASSGLGREIALYLAKNEGANLILAARRKDRLNDLATHIRDTYQVQVKWIQIDLNDPGDIDRLFREAVASADVYALINNAGMTYYGSSSVADWSLFERIVQVNLMAMMKLNLLFLELFKEKSAGAILNITSQAAFSPLPYQAVYSASKHAAQAFSEAIHRENRRSGVVISTFAPGGIATEMNVKSGLVNKFSLDSRFNMNAERVARLAIKSFKKGNYSQIPGLLNKFTVFLTRFVPRRVITWMAERIYRLPMGSE